MEEDLLSDEQLIEKLKSLQSPLKNLRQQYKRTPVNIDYSDKDIQLSYLIGYCPYYAESTFRVLSKLDDVINLDDGLEVSLVGSGCCPEAFGILKYLQNKGMHANYRITVKSFDINIEGWAYSRNLILKKFLLTHFQDCKINDQTYYYDFTDTKNNSINTQIADSRIILFQNCFNESSMSSHNMILHNIEQIISSMKSNSVLLFIDFLNYGEVRSLFVKIFDYFNNQGLNTLGSPTEEINLDLQDINNRMPAPIMDYLLNGESGLIARRRVKLCYMGAHKN